MTVTVAEALRLLADAIETDRAIKMKLVHSFSGHSKVHLVSELPEPYPRTVEPYVALWKTPQNWPDDCVEWEGRTKNGYGIARFASKKPRQIDLMSHRVAYLIAHGKIEPGLVVHHQCNNRLCVNPKHLEAMDRSKNATLGLARHHGIIDD
jgi:hypothetical protein